MTAGPNFPIEVAHVWNVYVSSKRRDLHSEMRRRADVISRQYVRRLEMTGDFLPPDTTTFQRVPSRPAETRLSARLLLRASEEVSTRRFPRFLAGCLRRQRPTVVHAHFGTTGGYVSGVVARLRLPFIVSFYGVDVSQVLRIARWRRRYAAMFQRASRLIVLCDEARDRLVALGCPAEKIRLWNFPVHVEAYRYRSRTPGPRIRLITAARFVEKKGYPYLLRACARLVREGREITLTGVGYGPLRTELEGMAKDLGIAHRVRLIDTSGIDDFDAFYNKALQEHDLFVLPSTTAASGDDEGGPALSLVMAQAAGLPVVCTPFVGASQSVIDGKTGLFCAQDDPVSLAERISFLIDHPETWSALGEAGRDLAAQRFSFATQVEELVGIYRSVLADGHGQG